MNKENEEKLNDKEEAQAEVEETKATETTEAPEAAVEEKAEETPTEEAPAAEEAPAEAEAPKAEEAPVEEKAETKEEKPAEAKADKKKEFKPRGRRPRQGQQDQDKSDGPEMIEKVISVKRITKVTKGGKKLSFSALVVVGDGKNKVGYSLSKAAEVATAIRKAMTVAKKNMISVPLRGTTITHEVIGQCSGSRVLLKPASDGTGVIASGPVRAVCDGAGIHNILTKCHRSNNPINVVKATIEGLSRLKRVESKVAEEAPAEEKVEV